MKESFGDALVIQVFGVKMKNEFGVFGVVLDIFLQILDGVDQLRSSNERTLK